MLREGFVVSGMLMLLVERPQAEWTVDKVNHIMHHDKTNNDETARLAALSLLSSN